MSFPYTQSSSIKRSSVWIWLPAIILASFFGSLLALGIYPVIIILVLLVLGPLLVVYPKIGLWVSIIGALVFAGLIDLYFPALRPIKWVVTILSIALLIVSTSSSFLTLTSSPKSFKHPPSLMLWILGFVMCVVFSSLFNWGGLSSLSVGLKGYFQVWGLLFVIYFLIKDEKEAAKLMRFLLILGLIQLPFVLHQFIVLVPKRSGLIAAEHNIVAVDIVAGTFGGSMSGGGRSSSLALLIVVCVTLILASWREGLIGIRRMAVTSFILFLPLLLNEAKIIVVLLPVVMLLLFYDRILTNPFKFIAGLGITSMLLSALFAAYLLLPGAQPAGGRSIESVYRQTLEYNVGRLGYGGLALNRLTVYKFWFDEHMHVGSAANLLIGHGPGQTNDGSAILSNSLSTTRYPGYGIGLTGFSAMLWEIGLIGTGIALTILFSAYRLGDKLAKQWRNTSQWPLIKAAQISMPLFGISLLHNNFFIVDLSYQALFILLVSYLLVMSRFAKVNDKKVSNATKTPQTA